MSAVDRSINKLEIWYCYSCKTNWKEDFISAKNHIPTCGENRVYDSNTGQKNSIGESNLTLFRNYKYKNQALKNWGKRMSTQEDNFALTPLCRYNDNDIIRISRSENIKMQKNTLGSFTDAVYRLCLNKAPIGQLTRVKAAEKDMGNYWLNSDRVALNFEDWQLFYRDEETSNALKIIQLKCKNKPLWGELDTAFLNDKTEELIIVKRKLASQNVSIPGNGWPHLRGQLGAYSLAYIFAAFSKIRLVAKFGVKASYMPRLKVGNL